MPEQAPLPAELRRLTAELEDEVRRRTAELTRANEALRESEQRFRTLVDHAPEAIVVLDADRMRYVDANELAERMFKLDRQALLEVGPIETSPPTAPDGRPAAEFAREMVQRAMGGEAPVFEWTHLDAEGNEIQCEVRLVRLPSSRGHLIRGSIIDITDRKRTEETLRSIFRAAPTGIGVVSARVLQHVNQRLCEMVGYSAEELVGQSARILYPTEEDFEYVGREKYAQIREHGTGTVETRWRCKDGHIIDVLLSSTPIDPSDLKAGITFTALDITDRKRAVAELQQTQALLQAAIESTPAGVIIADAPDVNIRLANSAALGIRGQTAEVLTHIPAEQHPRTWQTYHWDGTPYKPEELPLSRAILEGVVSQNVEAIIRHESGEDRWVLANAAPVRDADGQIVAGVVVFSDVTDRKRAAAEREQLEAQLQQSQKLEAVGQLAGGVAHDFNNILTAILGNVELALEAARAESVEKVRLVTALEQVERAAQRAARLTRQLLIFSRRDVVRPDVVNLNQTLTDMEKMLRRVISEDIALDFVRAAELRAVHVDAGQIEQVVMNLVVNARDAMPEGGRLTLETGNVELDESYTATHAGARSGPHVMLAVSDNGCGMSRETVARVFEPFFTTKPVGQGTGLGLATLYGIVKRAGGHVRVYSEVGRGSTFKVYLPAAEAAVAEVLPTSDEGPSPTGDETLLVCEDDPTVRRLVSHMLRESGYTVLAAENGGEALQVAAAHPGPIHLLVSDVIMPDMNGRALAEALGRSRPDVRILFVSGYASNVIAHHGVLDEGVEFLEKPFSRGRLLRRVREVLEPRRQELARR